MQNASKSIHLVCIAAEYRGGVEDTSIPPAGCLYIGDALKKTGYRIHVHHISSSQIDLVALQISETSSLFVGFSILTGSPVAHSAKMSKIIKSRSPITPIVWGGIHPSLMPETCLKEDFVDYVIRGEGEITSQELANALANNGSLVDILGLCWKDSAGNIHINERRPFIKNLDLFRQDWSLVNVNKYIRTGIDGTKYFTFITSRGCPHNCGFCYNLVFNKRRWRAHSVEFVKEEIQKIRELTGIDSVVFYDDNFIVNKNRAFQILKRLQEIGVRVYWLEVRLDEIDENILSQLSHYGVRTLFVGWESGSNRTLKKIDKGFNTDLILEGFQMAAKFSFEIDASAIVGFPFETEQDWQATYDMVLRIDSINPGRNKFNVGIYVPYPGTPIAKLAIDNGFRFPNDIMKWDSFDIIKGNMEMPWITQKEAKQIALRDRYAKMLFVAGFRNRLVTLIRKLFAVAARLRFKSKCFWAPVEAKLFDQIIRIYLKYRMASIKNKSNHD